MYNGIGLPTPRGSGTSGYVVKNLAYKKPRTEFTKEQTRPPKPPKKPNPELVQHEQKRQIEVHLISFRQKLKDEGTEEEEIETRVKKAREHLLSKLGDAPVIASNSSSHKAIEKNNRIEKLRNALNIKKSHVHGEAFDFEEKKRHRSRSR